MSDYVSFCDLAEVDIIVYLPRLTYYDLAEVALPDEIN